LTAAAQVI